MRIARRARNVSQLSSQRKKEAGEAGRVNAMVCLQLLVLRRLAQAA